MTWRESMNEDRPDYILAIRAQALDKVQDLIWPEDRYWPGAGAIPLPTPEAWEQIIEAAFPPPPMASIE